MEVILLERVSKLGQMGDVVTVKPGYARNFLLPMKKALRASTANIKAFEAQKAQLEAQNLETRKEAEELANKLKDKQFTVIRSASDAGSLYGSVSTRDAAEAATEAGFTIERKQVMLSTPIKELGLHEVTVSLHPEVEVPVQLNVARSEEEAALQAAGKSTAAVSDEAEPEFDVSELFDDPEQAQIDDPDQMQEENEEQVDLMPIAQADAGEEDQDSLVSTPEEGDGQNEQTARESASANEADTQ